MSGPTIAERQGGICLLARAAPERLAELLPGSLAAHVVLRVPEIGAVMVRGRIGATGAPFNSGELTVSRCSVRLETGPVGHAHVQGRDRDHACRAAVINALMKGPEAATLRRTEPDPRAQEEAVRRHAGAASTVARKGELLTLVRGEDA